MWALLLAVALPIIYILPSGFIYAMTGQEVGFFLFCFCFLLDSNGIEHLYYLYSNEMLDARRPVYTSAECARIAEILPLILILTTIVRQITLNILAQIIPGSLLPGNPLANMVRISSSVLLSAH